MYAKPTPPPDEAHTTHAARTANARCSPRSPAASTPRQPAGERAHISHTDPPIAPHITSTQRYLHPDMSQITGAGTALTAHLNPVRAPLSLAVQPAPGRRR
ncbi:hypothetical protein ACFYXL_11010 [Streptomyces tsukubensis]|uniref:hypothetical protein n=1 Tax=Streptomyces tsukubensis TaxID=83656 RepID=UPI00367FB706